MFLFAAIVSAILIQNKTLTVILFLIELTLGIICDRSTIKQYHQYISGRKDRINKVTLFLKTVIPGKDLSSKKQVEELIERLSARIDIGAPLNKLKSLFSNFGKIIILPIIAYVAGAYTTNVREFEFTVVFTWTISIILIIGLVYIPLGILFPELQKIICRNYGAAIALREDLLDIKLLSFCERQATPGIQPSDCPQTSGYTGIS